MPSHRAKKKAKSSSKRERETVERKGVESRREGEGCTASGPRDAPFALMGQNQKIKAIFVREQRRRQLRFKCTLNLKA